MPTLYANPYDISATGFYFDSLEDYEEKAEKLVNEYGDPVEEFEIEFIDGDNSDLDLFKAMGVHQGNIDQYFEYVDTFDEEDIVKLAILTEDIGYDVKDALDRLDDLIVYGEFDSDEAFAMEWIENFGGIREALGERANYYFDYEAFGRDLRISGDLEDPDDPDNDRYEGMSDREIGESIVDDAYGGVEEMSESTIDMYFDWESFARDLMMDMGVHNSVYYDPSSV